MSGPAQAIFLSYASQDADAARRTCDALRAASLEVWFDQSELRGGDAWDASIRKHKTYPGGHSLLGWYDDMVKDTHDWFDEHFGAVALGAQK